MTLDLSKLSFYSGTRYERVALKSSQPFTVAGGGFGQTTVTIAHNLGYKPYYKAWYTFGGGKYFQLFAGTGSFNIDGNSGQIDNVSVTTASLIVVVDNFGVPAISGTVYYRIYAEPQT
jgi:hypothetical protein